MAFKKFREPVLSQYNDEKTDEGGSGTAVQETRPKLKKPPLYKVILLNDDFTPMDFVVEVLMRFFVMNEEQATRIMMHVHTRGVGVCGVFSRDVAETKVQQVNEYARRHQHPLLCTMEEA
ncbi:MAG: ATP-dependent Clp protease adapter ClpS [Methylohalobius sp. ZOD2]